MTMRPSLGAGFVIPVISYLLYAPPKYKFVSAFFAMKLIIRAFPSNSASFGNIIFNLPQSVLYTYCNVVGIWSRVFREKRNPFLECESMFSSILRHFSVVKKVHASIPISAYILVRIAEQYM